MDQLDNKLLEIAGDCNPQLLFCPSGKCPGLAPPSKWFINTTFPYILDLCCYECNTKWSICTECSRTYTPFKSIAQLDRHHYNRHRDVQINRDRKRKSYGNISKNNINNINEAVNSVETIPPSLLPVLTVARFPPNDDNIIMVNSPLVQEIIPYNLDDMIDTSEEEELLPNPKLKAQIIFPSNKTPHIAISQPQAIDLDCFKNDSYKNYFTWDQSGLGIQYLVALSQFNNNTFAKDIDKYEADTMIYISFLVRGITFAQRTHLSEIFKRIIHITKTKKIIEPISNSNFNGLKINHNNNTQDKTQHHSSAYKCAQDETQHHSSAYECDIPTSYNEIRRYIIEGKYSIYNNLPTPRIKYQRKHASVSILECAADLLAFGFPTPSYICNFGEDRGILVMDSLHSSVRARKYYTQFINSNPTIDDKLFLLVILWSDDFEPNYSIKANRQSVHIITATFIPENDTKSSIFYTYPISVSKKKTSHESAFKQIHDDIISTFAEPKLMYSKNLNKNINVSMNLIASLHDQPERREIMHLARGNSKYHGRFGYCMDSEYLANVLKPCKQCYLSLLKETNATNIGYNYFWRSQKCKRCTCWSFFPDTTLLRFPAPTNYPPEFADSKFTIPSTKLNFEKLVDDVKLCHNNIVNSQWTSKTAESFLKSLCLSIDTIDDIIEHGFRTRLIEIIKLKSKKNLNDAESEILIDYQNNPKKYEMWKCPAIWRKEIPIDSYVDAPMHLLFLGIAKSLFMDIREFLISRNKNTSFIKFSKNVLELVECMQLPWLKILPYPTGKFGGFVAENYLALTRLSLWFYGPLSQVNSDIIWEEPKTEHSKWAKKDNQKWLKIRGLDTNGNANDLKDRVASYMTNTNEIPPIIPPRGGSTESVLEVIRYFYNFIENMMVTVYTPVIHNKNEVNVRLFLCKYSQFVELLYPGRQKFAWISRYNFLSLCSLVNQCKDLGSPKELWEGGYKGEGYLRVVKPTIKSGLRNKWEVALMTNLTREKTLSTICKDMCSLDTIERLNYRIYPSKAHLLRLLIQGKPISLCYITDCEYENHYGVCYNKIQEVYCNIIRSTELISTVNGLTFYKYILTDNEFQCTGLSFKIGAVLLPQLEITKVDKRVKSYTLINSNWELIDGLPPIQI